MKKVSFGVSKKLTSEDLNARFGDLAGGSLLSGFRLAPGSSHYLISLVRDTAQSMKALLPDGTKIEETGDALDVVAVRPNLGNANRIDVLYATYTHKEGSTFSYELVEGVAGLPLDVVESDRKLALGYVTVRPRQAVIATDLTSFPLGLKKIGRFGETIKQVLFTTTENQTVINLEHDFLVGQNRVSLTIGGVKQFFGKDYDETSTRQLTMKDPLPGGLAGEVLVSTSTKVFAEDFKKETDAAKQATLDAMNAAKAANEAKVTAYTEQKTPVANLAAIGSTYPTAVDGSEVQTLDDGKIYRKEKGVWVYRKELTPGPVSELLSKFEMQKYYINPKEYGAIGDGVADDTTALQTALDAVSQTGKTLFLTGSYVLTSPINWKGKTLGGTIILKNTANINMKSRSEARHISVLVHTSCTSIEAVLFEELEASIENFLISATSGTIRNNIGLHFKGKAVTCFNRALKGLIRYAGTGIYIDSTTEWVTNIELDHLRIDYFNAYALRVGSDNPNSIQNSQHNITNITIQDTGGTIPERIGLSMGDTWSNYANIVTFADNPTGVFIPLHMPLLPDQLPEIIRVTRANTLNGMVLEGNPKCNGYAYLHQLNGIRSLRNQAINGRETHFSQMNSMLQPAFKLSDNPTIRLPQNIVTDLVTPGNVTYTYANGTVTIKNNTTTNLYFLLDIKLPTKVKNDLKNGKFTTVLLNTDMAGSAAIQNKYVCSLRDGSGISLDAENIGHHGVTSQGQISFAAFKTTSAVLNATDVYLRVGFSSLPGNTTYTLKELQFYTQLVPSINANNAAWMDASLFN